MRASSTHEHSQPRQPSLSAGIKWSTTCHIVLLALFLLKSFVFPGKPVPYIPTLKVDLVGLPDVLKKDLTRPHSQLNQDIAKVLKQAEHDANRIKSNTKPKELPKDIAKPDEMVIKPKIGGDRSQTRGIEKRNKRALERLKALSKIQDSAEPKVVKGNKISPGSSLSGEAKEAATESYYDLVQDRLQEHWALPAWIARQNLAAQVQVFIDANGKLRGIKFTKPSGNSRFDDEVKRTLQESEPFPAPPDEIANSLVTDGILVGFPL